MNKQQAIEELKENSWEYENNHFQYESAIDLEDAEDIVSQINEPQKVVVPKFVAEWIGWCKANDVTLIGGISTLDERWAKRNQETFARAWLDGYEIEQEKLYTVEIPNPNGDGYGRVYLSRKEDNKIELRIWNGFSSIEFSNDWKKFDDAQLTEAEIKKDFEWAFQFAKPVEEN